MGEPESGGKGRAAADSILQSSVRDVGGLPDDDGVLNIERGCVVVKLEQSSVRGGDDGAGLSVGDEPVRSTDIVAEEEAVGPNVEQDDMGPNAEEEPVDMKADRLVVSPKEDPKDGEDSRRRGGEEAGTANVWSWCEPLLELLL